jgi:hypothetical protein
LRRIIKSLPGADLFKFVAVVLVGAMILLLFAVNRYAATSCVTGACAPKAAGFCLFYIAAVWVFGSTLSTMLLFLFDLFAGLGRLIFRLFQNPHRKELNPMNFSRRRFLKAGLGGLASTPFILAGYGAVHAGKAFEVKELSLSFGRSLRVVHLTDIHAGIFMTGERIRKLTDRVNALRPDLLVLTGDYISNSMDCLPECIEQISKIHASYGAYATLGNHEHWYGELDRIRAVFSHYRIPLLHNSHRIIRTKQGSFAVAGIDDLRAGKPDLDAALHGLDPDMPVLLLSHRPEIFPEAAAHGIRLTLAGHYHGGQVKLRLPSGDFSFANLLTPYPEGLFQSNDSQLYVSSGIGTTFTPVRLNVPPEITLLHLA